LNWPWQRNKTQTLTEAQKAPRFKAAMFVGKGTSKDTRVGEFSRSQVWTACDQLYVSRSEVASQLISLAGYVVGRGYATVPSNPKDATALKAKMICDSFARDNGIDQMIFEGSIYLALHGNLFLENRFVQKKLARMRIFPWQYEVEPSTIDIDGSVLEWRQARNYSVITEFKENEIVALRLPPIDKDGFGTSLVQPIREILNIKQQTDRDSKDFVHLTAFPKELIQLGDAAEPADKTSVDDAYAKWKGWAPGEVFIVNLPTKYQACGVGQVESRLFPSLIRTFNDQCIDAMIMPPMSYLRNATEASANAMIAHARTCIVQPFQRLWKRALEREIFEALLEGEGINPEYVPSISFTPPNEQELLLRTQRVINTVNAKLASVDWGRDQLDIADEANVSSPASTTTIKGSDKNELGNNSKKRQGVKPSNQ